MKRILTTLLMAVGLTGPLVTHLAAQSNTAVAEIPFAFVANQRTYPAGTYRVSEGSDISRSLFKLEDPSRHSAFVMMATREDGNPAKPSLTFACYGNDRVLAKITPPGSSTAYALSRDSIEKNLHHTLGMSSMVSIKLAPR
jgi:hypothetical protein